MSTQAIYSLPTAGWYAYVGLGTGLETAGGIGLSKDGGKSPPLCIATKFTHTLFGVDAEIAACLIRHPWCVP